LLLLAEPAASQQPARLPVTASVQSTDNALTEIEVEIVYQEAIAAFHQRDYSTALQFLNQIPQRTPAQEYYRGLSLLRLKNYQEAAAVLGPLSRSGAVPEDLRLDAAIAELKAGQVSAAADGLKGIVSRNPDDGHARFFHAVALYEQGRLDEANTEMNLAVSYQPELQQYQELYRDYDQRLGAAALGPAMSARASDASRNWNLSILTGYEYDSNVPQSPEFSGLGSNFEREDSAGIIGLFGDYRFIQEADQVLGVYASTYTNWHYELTDFDVQSYSGGGYWNHAFGDWIVGANYQFGETLLDKEQFATNHRLTPSVTYRWCDAGHTTAYYEYENLELESLALIPAQVRSGDTNALGVTHAMYIGPRDLGRVFFGYRYGDTDADGSDFDMQSNMVNARIEYPIYQDLVWDLGARYFRDEYESPNSLDFFDRVREDDRVEIRTGLQKLINENVSIRLDYTYVDSNSNVANLFGVEFYSYQRHVLNALLIYDF
jgi:tetratricopeptide (TPR) repeat protein